MPFLSINRSRLEGERKGENITYPPIFGVGETEKCALEAPGEVGKLVVMAFWAVEGFWGIFIGNWLFWGQKGQKIVQKIAIRNIDPESGGWGRGSWNLVFMAFRALLRVFEAFLNENGQKATPFSIPPFRVRQNFAFFYGEKFPVFPIVFLLPFFPGLLRKFLAKYRVTVFFFGQSDSTMCFTK